MRVRTSRLWSTKVGDALWRPWSSEIWGVHGGDRSGRGSSGVVLAMVPFSDRFYYSSSKKTRTKPVRSGFVPNGFFNLVLEYSCDNLVFGTWNMELLMAHRLVVSAFWYLQNSGSGFEIIVILGRKTRFLGYCLERFNDIGNRRRPKDAPCWAAYFTYQTLNSLINTCGLRVMVRLKNRRFLMG